MKFKLEEQWVEALAVLLAVVGFILSVLLRNALLSYLTIIAAGLVAGRGFFVKRYAEPVLPFVLLIAGFLVGYLAGGIWVSRLLLLFLFLAAFIVSYYLHKKGVLTLFRQERWVK